MTEDQRELLVKARDSVRAARVLLAEGFPDFAASRAYYAMFYVAEAFLEGDGLSFSKHSAVIAGFGQHFVRAARIPSEFHRYLIEALDVRHQGDYGLGQALTDALAGKQISRAVEFLELAERKIGSFSDEA